LKFTNFGFSVSGGATIVGIKVRVKKSAGAANTIRDNEFFIIKGGTYGVTNYADATDWPTSPTDVIYGGPTSLFNETWTPADINSSNFGFVLSVKHLAASAPQARVDYAEVTIYVQQ
jgi:hypothetical protein